MRVTKDTWLNYVNYNQLDKIDISFQVADSWKYCLNNNVNPYAEEGIERISLNRLNNVRHDLAHIIELVKYEVNRYQDYFRVAKPIFILTDQNGVIVWRDGHHETKTLANNIRFYNGSVWTEKAVGTNAIGISLRTGESSIVTEYEHFSRASHPFTCQAVPIIDEKNDIIACLNVSTPENQEDSSLTLLALEMTAKNIHDKLLIKEQKNQESKLKDCLKTEYISGMICNEKREIISISDDWDQKISEWYMKKSSSFEQKMKLVGDYSVTPLKNEDTIVGYFYQILLTNHLAAKEYVSFGIHSKNVKYQKYLSQLLKSAESKLPIHIYGETGSGKEVSAKTIHYNSLVKNAPLITLNCGAFNDSLLESELFGYASGAFTGASKAGYQGKIRQADGGTLFLDEIDSMSSRMQVALLRVLEEKIVHPVGSTDFYTVNFRLVTASNKNLKELVAAGKFREDLFYRIYVLPLTLPALRERPEDIEVLIEHFCKKNKWTPKWKSLLLEEALNYHWPGNIREFMNFLERVHLFYPITEPSKFQIQQLMLQGAVRELQNEQLLDIDRAIVSEKSQIEFVLKENNYHITKTAKQLNMARSTLYRKIDKYHIVF
ncbi:sigma-54-dependent Fis family transcriptional regulator [Vagococcus vulneris]|uniref:Sigma-54 factor interaction domain-containing protein n=1 Tax=Vagococcus vulneris TaxID=1977869 RepID=A0A430A1K6_9ENTE|nr:sigma-54-dependent Fis family transcriptional regulator [Vagococcus vulneris]RSU00260.1 hypothetical protein CBF37_02890 [Vagococcus vulneris]